MKFPKVILRWPVALLLLQILVLPGSALAQHSASATETVVFAVLPVHSGAAGAAALSVRAEKVTVSVEPPPAGISSPVRQAGPHMLVTSDSLLTRLPRGSSLLVTVTE